MRSTSNEVAASALVTTPLVDAIVAVLDGMILSGDTDALIIDHLTQLFGADSTQKQCFQRYVECKRKQAPNTDCYMILRGCLMDG